MLDIFISIFLVFCTMLERRLPYFLIEALVKTSNYRQILSLLLRLEKKLFVVLALQHVVLLGFSRHLVINLL